MASKMAKPYEADMMAGAQPTVDLHIEGLEPMGNGVFRLTGVAPRALDMRRIANAMDMDFMPDSLADAIGNAVFKHDIAEILADRTNIVRGV
jgi:hypothetical protein